MKILSNVDVELIITSECISCGACVPTCPCPGTIVWSDQLERYVIRQDHCNDCVCEFDCIDVCPAEAIKQNPIVET